jgi:hypothetical protein
MDGGSFVSLKVLVIPEDPTLNGYILYPLVAAILADLGKRNAKIQVLTNPSLKGYDHAMQAIRQDLPDKYSHWDIWLFVPDADRAKREAMNTLEAELADKGITLFCSPAQPEIEIYACVAYRNELSESWKMVREAASFKEVYFKQVLDKHGDKNRAGGGRDLLINESLKNMRGLYQLCPELKNLRDRLDAHFKL